jgi:hypothetical protein
MSLVQHYVNIGDVSSFLDPTNPYAGLSEQRVELYENNLTCTFTRENNYTGVQSYFAFAPGTNYYLVAAYGQIITDRNF